MEKIREKSGGHLYHHIHELDCVQFIMGGMPKTVTMAAANVAHKGENFGDEDDMIFVTMDTMIIASLFSNGVPLSVGVSIMY